MLPIGQIGLDFTRPSGLYKVWSFGTQTWPNIKRVLIKLEPAASNPIWLNLNSIFSGRVEQGTLLTKTVGNINGDQFISKLAVTV